MHQHRLWREIIATQIVNNVAHGAGTSMVYRIHEETGAYPSNIARAYTIAREIFQMRPIWHEVEQLDNVVPADAQTAMLLEGRRVIERATRWLLRNRRNPLDIAAIVGYFAPGAAALYDAMPGILAVPDREPIEKRAEGLRSAGVPDRLAMRVASMGTMYSALDIVEVADEAGLGVDEVAAVHFRLGSRLELHWLRDRINALPRDDRWGALARAALRDDLYWIHRSITTEVLRATAAGSDAERRVDGWVDANPAADRYLQTLADVRTGRAFDMTTLPVVVREVRNLLG
jgi:glutamate dehydrogenase